MKLYLKKKDKKEHNMFKNSNITNIDDYIIFIKKINYVRICKLILDNENTRYYLHQEFNKKLKLHNELIHIIN